MKTFEECEILIKDMLDKGMLEKIETKLEESNVHEAKTHYFTTFRGEKVEIFGIRRVNDLYFIKDTNVVIAAN